MISNVRSALALSSLCALACLPFQAQETPPASDSATTTIVVNVNKVLIPVIVRDKQGHAVGTLKKENFQVFENDRPQTISSFTIERRGAANGSSASADQPFQLNLDPQAQTPPPPRPTRFVIFLFDDMHLEPEDVFRVQKASLKALSTALTDTDMAAVVSTSGKTNSGLTTDRATLQEAIMSVRPHGIHRSSTTDCPYIPYYQAVLIQKRDSGALAEAIRQVFNCNPGMDPQREVDTATRLAESSAMQVQMVGHQDVQITYGIIREIVRRMATLPGQRSLILVSPGFLTVEAETMSIESQLIDLAASSNVTISAIDARGLYTTSMTASQTAVGDTQYQAEILARTMQADENPMAELAFGTGGTFFHNSNDLDTGFKEITQAAEYLYLLEISPNIEKPDGSYHHLKVKVDQPGLDLQARQGYFVPKPAKTKKEKH